MTFDSLNFLGPVHATESGMEEGSFVCDKSFLTVYSETRICFYYNT